MQEANPLNYVQALQDELEAMTKGAVQMLPSLVIAMIVLIVTWILARFAVKISDRITRHTSLRADLKQLIVTLVRTAIWIIGSIVALTVAIPSFTPGGAIAGLGVGALAIGFAFQDILENFLAGVLLMLRNKMNVGDVIESEGILGRVEKTTLRETHIRQLSNELTVVPNSLLFKNPVKILTDEAMRRDEVIVGVSYDTDLETAQKIILQAVESVEAVSDEKPAVVFARAFGASSIDFLVQWWSQTTLRDMRETKSDVIMAVKLALDGAHIEIPYPYVTNTFKQDIPVKQIEADASDKR